MQKNIVDNSTEVPHAALVSDEKPIDSGVIQVLWKSRQRV